MEDNSNTVVQNAVDYLLSNDSEFESMNNNIQENSHIGGSNYNKNYNLSKNQINEVNETLSVNTDKSFMKMKKFVKAMHSKYHNKKLSLPEIVEKSRKYAKKVGIRDSEYKLFEVLYQNKLDEANIASRNGTAIKSQVNKIGNSLGTVKAPYIDNKKLNFNKQDKPFIDEIMRIAVSNAAEHSTVVMQTHMYNIHGVHKIVQNALLSKTQHNVSCAVHPLVVALFGPKITILDERMLLSNLARLIVDRIEGKPVKNKADFEFFVDLTTDQQEFVCDSKSLFHDMLKRIHVQEMLRKNVWQMRGGQFFDCDGTKLIQALDQCSLNPSESPHLLYVRDEGQMLRRLLAAFSFKPTHVTTRPIFAFNMAQPTIGRLDQLSMININIPHHMFRSDVDQEINLEDGLKTPHWYIQNQLVVPKQQNLVYSREVIFFYINRRYTSLGNTFNSSFMFNRTPTAINGFNQVNNHPVKFKNNINLHQYPYILRSCVCVTKNKSEQKVNDPNFYNGCQSFLWVPDVEGIDEPTGFGDKYITGSEFFDNQSGGTVTRALDEWQVIARRNSDNDVIRELTKLIYSDWKNFITILKKVSVQVSSAIEKETLINNYLRENRDKIRSDVPSEIYDTLEQKTDPDNKNGFFKFIIQWQNNVGNPKEIEKSSLKQAIDFMIKLNKNSKNPIFPNAPPDPRGSKYEFGLDPGRIPSMYHISFKTYRDQTKLESQYHIVDPEVENSLNKAMGIIDVANGISSTKCSSTFKAFITYFQNKHSSNFSTEKSSDNKLSDFLKSETSALNLFKIYLRRKFINTEYSKLSQYKQFNKNFITNLSDIVALQAGGAKDPYVINAVPAVGGAPAAGAAAAVGAAAAAAAAAAVPVIPAVPYYNTFSGNINNYLFSLLLLSKLQTQDHLSHATILKYNPYSYFSEGIGRTSNDYPIGSIAPSDDLSGVFKYCNVTEECYKFIEENATIFVYSQKMKDVRGQLPFQALNVPFFPSVDQNDLAPKK